MIGIEVLLALVGALALALGAFYAILWLVARFVHRVAAAGLGAAAVAFLIYGIITGLATCSGGPIEYIPPSPGSGSEGTHVFACDAPAGPLIYFSVLIVYPIVAAALALITFRITRRR